MYDDTDDDKVVFHYELSPEYRVVYANGAFGSITPRGDIKYDLFIEYVKAPEAIVHIMTPDGLGPEVDREPAKMPISRELQIGVMMTPGQAKSFAHWLLSKVSELEGRKRTQS